MLTVSKSNLVGCNPSSNLVLSYPNPINHLSPCGGFSFNSFFNLSSNSSFEVTSPKVTIINVCAVATTCPCGSIKPGIIVFPSKSTTVVSSSFNDNISSLVPTAFIKPFSTNTASAIDSFLSTVITCPLK